MKNFCSFVFFSLIGVSSFIFGDFIEVSNFSEITNYIDQHSTIILDLDDTIIFPNQTLGNSAWFSHRLEQNLDLGWKAALEKTRQELEAVQNASGFHLVEEGIADVISQLRGRYKIIGVTKQRYSAAPAMIDRLNSLKVYFSALISGYRTTYFMSGKTGVFYNQGVLFCDSADKVIALSQLFDQARYRVSKIVYISSNFDELKKISKRVNQYRTLFIGLHYQPYNPAENFRADIADLEWMLSSFGNIIDDDTAQDYLDWMSPKGKDATSL